MNLNELGWNDFFESQLLPEEKHLLPARVIRHDLSGYHLLADDRAFTGSLPGRFRHVSTSKADLPTVGDWVLVSLLDTEPDKAIIRKLLRRQSQFSRKEAGDQVDEQIVAANIDIVFIVSGLDDNLISNASKDTCCWHGKVVPRLIYC